MLSSEQLPLHFHLGTEASEWLAAKPHSLSFPTSINIGQRGGRFWCRTDIRRTVLSSAACYALLGSASISCHVRNAQGRTVAGSPWRRRPEARTNRSRSTSGTDDESINEVASQPFRLCIDRTAGGGSLGRHDSQNRLLGSEPRTAGRTLSASVSDHWESTRFSPRPDVAEYYQLRSALPCSHICLPACLPHCLPSCHPRCLQASSDPHKLNQPCTFRATRSEWRSEKERERKREGRFREISESLCVSASLPPPGRIRSTTRLTEDDNGPGPPCDRFIAMDSDVVDALPGRVRRY